LTKIMLMFGTIAIVGRPNVGKSALFNRIAGRQISIVHDEPGVTRDRIIAQVEWHGRAFTLIDTGGIGLLKGEKTGDPIKKAAIKQVELAIDSASVIFMVVDIKEGITPLDEEISNMLRESGKSVIVVANKADQPHHDSWVSEFSSLGFDKIFPVSALHDRGIAPLMAWTLKLLTKIGPANQPPMANQNTNIQKVLTPDSENLQQEKPVKLAIVGRPNVGKSSIINAIIGSERVIVSDIPGTTRDAVEVPFTITTNGIPQNWILIDTAGLRKPKRIKSELEFFSIEKTKEAIRKSDIITFVLDAEQGILEQDKKIGDLITEAQKACIIVVNKWDLFADAIEKAKKQKTDKQQTSQTTSLTNFAKWVQEQLFFIDYAPVIFASAKTGTNINRLIDTIKFVASQYWQEIPTAILNRIIRTIMQKKPPSDQNNKPMKFFYATQISKGPPEFVLFFKNDTSFSKPYEKFLAGEIRKTFGFEGTPLIFKCRPKP